MTPATAPPTTSPVDVLTLSPLDMMSSVAGALVVDIVVVCPGAAVVEIIVVGTGASVVAIVCVCTRRYHSSYTYNEKSEPMIHDIM